MNTARPGFAGPAALVPGELRGYRRFRLAEDGLYSTVHGRREPWSGPVEHAACAAGADHAAPAWDCSCGLYGWYHPADASLASGFGDVTAVIAARGRCILGDHGFRAASARIEAVALPARLRASPGSAARVRQMLAACYPRAIVYRSRRQMLRAYPPHDLQELGIDARISGACRYRRIARVVWLLGVAACLSVPFLPGDRASEAGAGTWVSALGLFLLWQALLAWLVARESAPPRKRAP